MLTITIKALRAHYSIGKNTVCYNRGDEHKNPHYALWHQTLNYLRRRNFIVTKDPDIEQNYKCLSKDHSYGIKNGLEFKSHRYPTGFDFDFFQNVTKSENRNGGEFDFDKYDKMPYRLKLTLTNELNKLAEFFTKKGIEVEFKSEPKLAAERILKNHNTAHWVKHPIASLDEWQEAMKEYDIKQNSFDANKKQLICGETKWFYDYNRRLLRGKVYHNINNMWWVILNDTTVRNIARFYLFDYVPGMPFRNELTQQEKLNRLNAELVKAENARNYERCITLRNIIFKGELYNVWSLKHDCWWGPNSTGYTSDRKRAGIYTKAQIEANQSYYNNNKDSVAKPLI